MKIMWMMVAGGLGAGARYGLTIMVQRWLDGAVTHGWVRHILGASFPLGTLIVNVSGTFFLAFIVTLALHKMLPLEWGLILGTGFLGAFTTFSTFELESHGLLSSGQWTQASLYILGNLLLGFAAVLFGSMLAIRLASGLK